VFRWINGKSVPVAFPEEDEPRTIFHIRQLGNDDWAVLQSAIEKSRTAAREVGRDPLDPDIVRKNRGITRSALAGAIERIENVVEPGDSIESKEEIEERLRLMPEVPWNVLLGLVTAGLDLKAYEVKR
jgi:hypothetical protein